MKPRRERSLKAAQRVNNNLRFTDCVDEAVFAVFLSIQHAVLDEDRDSSQDEGHKQIHVNEVPGAVELPGANKENGE